MTQELTTFAALGLADVLLQALDDLQFVTPSPIQQQTIPWLLQGRDLVGLAQTGTGKTAAFALPILQRLAAQQLDTQALIITPTRELAIQVAEHFESLSAHQRGIRVSVLCGGQDYRPQLKKLREGAQIVVGTPGRVLDHLERGTLQLAHLKTFVLDEADEMLRMGFIEDVEAILAKLPAERQMALFSATMPARIRHIATRYLNDPVSVEIRTETATVKSIEQRFLFASQHQKPGVLLRVLAVEEHQGVIVFVRTKNSADETAEFLQQHGHHAMAIHGDLTQALRERIIAQFKQGAIDILVATDVAARGLDVDRVTHVINYDIAHDCETYVHRIGRTGRAGRSGVTILFVTPKESRMLNILERHIRQRIEKVKVPTDDMIQAVRQQRFLSRISARLQHEHLTDYHRVIEDFIKKHNIAAVDVAAALALLLNQDKPWQSELSIPKLEQQEERGTKRKPFEARTERKTGKLEKGRKRFNDEYSQELFRLDVGKVHGVKPGNIVGAIANEAGLQSRFITGLKIHDHYSTVRLPSGMPKEVMHGLNKAWVCGRQLKLTSLGMD
ncbi:DEAD/DEAH box helicase [Legionella oakridgensis]|uniref:ATP-dependent RNA helicase DeaD n=2 Tax=Legionella oakridgensis TaxID=29423 RepID=W0BCG6_9GAMM|nr:DEAD/DEAH box helicase [Legionella oakridgensis]AHE66376.1 superfamily II DNA and RNA helicase [Legionella oakridgensis ATCC 33761 = DSM 21215]ETO93881.1 ATP-dependent RNA helicase CsdA [Legionella oakridgensis RV-2-2007]KTD44016.1 ATP-dependent RNA helicase [Legionella oakridgensis]STY19559.1 ATP-dependent RNA helicase DeaD [Legionella longbeachae]